MWVLGPVGADPSICIAGFIVLVMMHAKVAAYHFLNGDSP
jgi:hypothetical protein